MSCPRAVSVACRNQPMVMVMAMVMEMVMEMEMVRLLHPSNLSDDARYRRRPALKLGDLSVSRAPVT